MSTAYSGLDLLATAVVVLDDDYTVLHANPSAESLLGSPAKALVGQRFLPLFSDAPQLGSLLSEAFQVHWSYRTITLYYERPGHEALPISCTVTPIDVPATRLLIE